MPRRISSFGTRHGARTETIKSLLHCWVFLLVGWIAFHSARLFSCPLVYEAYARLNLYFLQWIFTILGQVR